jgi:hypothetical protein
MLIPEDETCKYQLGPGHECMEMLQFFLHCSFLKQALTKTDRCAVGSPFFGAFPSDRNPKETKDIAVYFFIHGSNCVHYTSEIL